MSFILKFGLIVLDNNIPNVICLLHYDLCIILLNVQNYDLMEIIQIMLKTLMANTDDSNLKGRYGFVTIY